MYDASTTLEVFYIGVDPRYRRYGIARNLLRTTLDSARRVAKELGLPEPELAYGIFTSNYSQALADKFSFEGLHSARYDQYRCHDGVLMSERIGPTHQTAKLAARRLSVRQ